MVKLMQSWRTRNGVLIISSPSADLVDKIARGLIEYRVFMTTPFFEQNFTLGKLSTVKRISTKDGGSNLYPFLKSHGKIYNYVRFFLPPKDMQKSYEKKRKRLEQEMNLRSIQEMEETNSPEDKTETKKAKDTEDAARKTHAMLYKSYVKGEVKGRGSLQDGYRGHRIRSVAEHYIKRLQQIMSRSLTSRHHLFFKNSYSL